MSTPKIIWIPLVIFLCMASLSTKLAGVVWIWLLMTGLVTLWITRTSSTQPQPLAHRLARTWLLFTAIALALKAMATIYWQDPWSERHAEIRLFLGAVGMYGLTRLYGMNYKILQFLTLAGFVFCVVGLFIILFFGINSPPTNPIPWAASVALVSCWLLGVFFAQTQSCTRWFALAGSCLGLLTVLSSQKRGAFGLLIILPLMAFFFWRQHVPDKPATINRSPSWLLRVGILTLIIGSLWGLKNTPFFQRPAKAVHLAFTEFQSSQNSLPDNYHSNVGARLYLWSKSSEAFLHSPLIGYGREQRIELLKKWAIDTQLENPIVFGHVHNDFFHILLDHGIIGLASFLSYGIGLILLILQLFRNQLAVGAITLSALLAMHLSASLTNVNFAHNYYPNMLSLFVCFSIWQFGTVKTTKAP